MLNKRATYGDDWGVPSAEHPAGPCLNRSAPGVEDGSYFEKAWVNDLMALPGAIMNSAGYTPNGTEDTATASQVFDALVNGRWSAIANYTVGTIVTASNGNQYYCKKDNGRDSSVVDPSSVIDRSTWVQYPFEEGSNSNGGYKIHYNETIEQWIRTTVFSGTNLTRDLPIELLEPDAAFGTATHSGSNPRPYGVVSITNTSITIESTENSNNRAYIYVRSK